MRRAVNITVSVLISVIFVLLGVFVFSSSSLRFVEALMLFMLFLLMTCWPLIHLHP